MPRPRFATSLCVIGASLLWTGSALASGFSTARFGGEQGNPLTDNPTAIYYNPAGIAESQGVHLFVEGDLAFRTLTYAHQHAPTDAPIAPPGTKGPHAPAGANEGEGKLFNVVGAPFLGATGKVGDLAIGAAFYVPLGGPANFSKNSMFENDPRYAGPVDGVQRWYSINGTIQSTYMSLAAAYKIRSIGLSLGVSGNVIHSSVESIRARNPDGSNVVELNSTEQEGRSLVNASGWQASFGIGALLEAVPKQLWLAASYQARPNVAGGMKLKGYMRNNFAGTLTPQSDVELHQDLPDILRLGVRYAVNDKVELRLFGDWTRWSVFQNQCLALKGEDCKVDERGAAAGGTHPVLNLPRHWRDGFGVRAGLSYWVRPWAEFFSGLGFDSSAAPNSTLEVGLPDFYNVAFALGGRFEVTKQFHLGAGYTHFFNVPRDNTGKSDLAKFAQVSGGPDAGGVYAGTTGLINVNADVAF